MQDQSKLDKMLTSLFERDQGDIDRKSDVLKEIYKDMPKLIQYISDATGIAPEKIVKYANLTAFNNNNVKVYDIIRIIRDFYVFKENDEKGMYKQ